MSFGYLFDPSVLLHDTGSVRISLPSGKMLDLGPHPSNAAITANIHHLLQQSGFVETCLSVAHRPATISELSRVHTPDYLERVQQIAESGGGEAGEVSPMGPHSFQAALVAAGCAISAVDAVLDGRVRAAYALTRPPGHHAMPGYGMGYCLFNNAAVAARHALARGLERVLILDWDVHHGNGTQEAFYADHTVLFISIHQEDWYPRGTGTVEERGSGRGEGFTVNIPMPPGTGDLGYLSAFDTLVAPMARRFRPQLVLLSAGQDPAMLDPLGRMLVSGAGFRALGARLRVLAEELCDGRIVALQEGGYSLAYTPVCTLFALEGLAGLTLGLQDPYAGSTEQAYAEQALSGASEAAIAKARHAAQVPE